MNAGSLRRTLLINPPLLMVATACSLLPAPQTAKIYRLSPLVRDRPGRSTPNTQLTIELPIASQSLDTNRIALTQGRTQFDYYADAVWTDRLPVLLLTLMVDAFEGDGHIAGVGRNFYDLTHGYLLRTEIREFEAQYQDPASGPPEIAAVLELQLSTISGDRLVGNKLLGGLGAGIAVARAASVNDRPEPHGAIQNVESRTVVLRRDSQQAQEAATHCFLGAEAATLSDPFDRRARLRAAFARAGLIGAAPRDWVNGFP
ncbi:MAG: membrane integrity-associated transporter subunit PqiC [Gammaproteobacteria bacterium]|nr:membrane integrity-associated transporter subunit PqiC [Gammaproteobacteria bacterium]